MNTTTDDQAVPLPPDAIKAAAVVLHDEDCGDDETTATCGRWQSGDRYPSPQGVTHVSYYEARARSALAAAADVLRAESATAERERILTALAESGHRDVGWLVPLIRARTTP